MTIERIASTGEKFWGPLNGGPGSSVLVPEGKASIDQGTHVEARYWGKTYVTPLGWTPSKLALEIDRHHPASEIKDVPTAESIAQKAAGLVGGDRAATHGDKGANHKKIAAMWNAFLGARRDRDAPLDPEDVALMMVLLKVARTQLGAHNPDDYVDMVGYSAVAGELAERGQADDRR